MFLAIREMIHDKARFLLIAIVIGLVGYVVYFLTGLAYGLATSYSQGVDKWQASGIILKEQANGVIGRSLITSADIQSIEAPEKALLGVALTATTSLDEQQDVSLFGVDGASFISPLVTEGRQIAGPGEVVISDVLIADGAELGTSITFDGIDRQYEVVGLTDSATFQTTPIVYMGLEDWRQGATEIAGMTSMVDDTTVNAVITRGQPSQIKHGDNLVWQSIDDYIFTLPGYSAQVATFSLMIGSLILITAFVLAIFIYILTIQKRSIFGILKAEGIPGRYISMSVMVQIIILSVCGLVVGAGASIATGLSLQSTIPFAIQPVFFVSIAGLFLICSLLGGLASVKAISSIDPVEAIK